MTICCWQPKYCAYWWVMLWQMTKSLEFSPVMSFPVPQHFWSSFYSRHQEQSEEKKVDSRMQIIPSGSKYSNVLLETSWLRKLPLRLMRLLWWRFQERWSDVSYSFEPRLRLISLMLFDVFKVSAAPTSLFCLKRSTRQEKWTTFVLVRLRSFFLHTGASPWELSVVDRACWQAATAARKEGIPMMRAMHAGKESAVKTRINTFCGWCEVDWDIWFVSFYSETLHHLWVVCECRVNSFSENENTLKKFSCRPTIFVYILLCLSFILCTSISYFLSSCFLIFLVFFNAF